MGSLPRIGPNGGYQRLKSIADGGHQPLRSIDGGKWGESRARRDILQSQEPRGREPTSWQWRVLGRALDKSKKNIAVGLGAP
jgi:hypothetical protein